MNNEHNKTPMNTRLVALVAIPAVALALSIVSLLIKPAAAGAIPWLPLAISVCGVLLTLGLGIATVRSQQAQNRNLIAALEAIAAGDLTSSGTVNYDETGAARRSLLQMRDKLVEINTHIQCSTHTVQSNSRDISENNQALAQRAEQQARHLEQTSSSMEEITATVSQNAEDAKEGNRLAKQAMEHARNGSEIVSRAVSAMREINNDSKRIADIINVIDDIAFQTNLLALNAAVEAARAGDQGRGFAVVATEVRNLAQRSAEAAHEIKALIEESLRKVGNGSALVNDSGDSLNSIVKAVNDCREIMDKIATASAEQASGIALINQSVLELDNANQQNTSMVQEVAVSSRELQQQAQNLTQITSFFHVDSVQPRSAQGARATAARAAAAPAVARRSSTPAATAKPQIPAPVSTPPAELVERRGANRPWSNNAPKQAVQTPQGSRNDVAKAAGSGENWDHF